MPLAPSHRNVGPGARNLDLPPPFRLVVLREVGDAFAHARTRARELGAGTLVFVGRLDLAEFAVVLEPDESLLVARLAFYAGMVALGNVLADCAPPQKPITINWPDAIRVDRGLVGGGRLAWPDGSEEAAVPEWLVFGAMIRTVWLQGVEAGVHPWATALAEEGFCDTSAERLAEGFARHLMATIARWQESGLAPLAEEYLAKLVPVHTRRGLARNGDLLIYEDDEGVDSRNLVSALRVPSWLDPVTGVPSLGPPVRANGADE